MKESTKGAILLFVLIAVVAGVWKYVGPMLFERSQRNASDAQKISETIRFGGDNFLGYWFITAPETRKDLARQGIQVDFSDDNGAYADRLKKFADKEYDAIVLPVNSYLKHGAQYKFPGVIPVALSESKGADGIVGFANRFPSGQIKDLNNSKLKVVYTGESPSSFLIDLTIADFDLFQLKNSKEWKVEVGGSKEVYEKARRNEGDVFVLWEPDLSKALALPGAKYLWGSDKFSGYITDVFVFRRDFVQDKPEAIQAFFKTYFRSMGIYANNRTKMIEEMSKSIGEKKEIVEKMIDKIDWFDLDENINLQFGLGPPGKSNDGLINTIIACTDVMRRTGQFNDDPLKGDPYYITNSSVLEELKNTRSLAPVASAGTSVEFVPLDENGWRKLKEVGTMRVEPITFQSWNNFPTEEGKVQIDKLADMLKNNYPGYRIEVRGHTGPDGDEKENIKLSLERAQAVMQRLIAVHGLDENRVRAGGHGSSALPQKKPDESPREYRYRLSRVEFVLFEANPL